jgi:hypothetical protein
VLLAKSSLVFHSRKCGLPFLIYSRSFRLSSGVCTYFSIPPPWVAASDDRCGCRCRNPPLQLHPGKCGLRFSVRCRPSGLRSEFTLLSQSSLGGCRLRSPLRWPLSESPFRVSSPQMRFAVLDLLSHIPTKEWGCTYLSIPPRWVVASDDRRGCHCRNPPLQLHSRKCGLPFSICCRSFRLGSGSHLLSNPSSVGCRSG